ncbi:LysR substrate-binding domain-containing protein [Conexibacter stalactiti]|uniref:LysR substrate-binding domain-containing protein n=1 Tax=Conexibacter stalactiti TaxID=1940611 RepID=A0ABU4HJG2_9ACTN|nr:LysR substrate-binding domain-containing protein [Conexibacter stalactiti]MDW5593453.1 LysR substrate-binding domain-containing protein [Conexibacter stalactiti]MEC5034094.1 LysR substrate-binding domain-containing protein [Conexibacter stalactiti]
MTELRQLRTFIALAEELSFTRAAERLFVGQQAVSKTVAQLERELGVQLVERTTREVRLTPAGSALLERGRAALAAADGAFEAAREIGRGLQGTVRVGVSPAIGPRDAQEAVAALRDGAPDVSVALVEVRPRDVRRMLRDRDLDVVLARTSGSEPDIDSAPLRPTPTTLWVPAGHRLTGGGPIALAELDGERLLTWSPRGTAFTDLLLERLAAAGARVEPVEARVTGIASALVEVPARNAVALTPAGVPPLDGVVEVPLQAKVTLPLLVLWPLGTPPAAVRRIRDAMSVTARA